jgi:hypothetical protein
LKSNAQAAILLALAERAPPLLEVIAGLLSFVLRPVSAALLSAGDCADALACFQVKANPAAVCCLGLVGVERALDAFLVAVAVALVLAAGGWGVRADGVEDFLCWFAGDCYG